VLSNIISILAREVSGRTSVGLNAVEFKLRRNPLITRLDGTPNAVTSTFAYELQFGHLVSVTDPLSHTSTFSYDQSGNLTTAADPLVHQTTFAYNSAGQVVSATDALNNTVQFG
jgi:YD repeat-containing protein